MIKGAELVIGDFDDVEVLIDGFTDAYAVFTMIPPAHTDNYLAFSDRIGDAICDALQRSNVKRVVNLSSMGANNPEGTGPIKGLYKLERKLDAIKDWITLIHLRPTYFMENLNAFIPMIQNQGIFVGSLSENLQIPMVATRDIGWKAADFLDSSAPMPNLIFEFVGPKDVTMQYVAEVFGKAFDHPDLRYQQISYEEDKKGMIDMGIPQKLAELLVEMYKAFNEGLIKPTQELKLTHHGMTTLEEFAQMVAHKTLTHIR